MLFQPQVAREGGGWRSAKRARRSRRCVRGHRQRRAPEFPLPPRLAGYFRVNRAFARSLASMLLPDDLVWVHDYHLIPFGAALRELDCRQPIGFFLHTPFPAAEVMRLLPNHRELVAALCAYDLVGFQTAADLEGFRDYLLRQAGGEDLGGGVLRAFGRTLRAAAVPIGIDVAAVAAQAAEAETSRQMRRLTASIRDRALIIGVDRID